MSNVEILTEELEKVDIKYMGLPFGIRQAMIRSMGRSNKSIARVLISANCRKTHGIDGAFDEACKRLKENYLLFANATTNKNRTWTVELNTSKE